MGGGREDDPRRARAGAIAAYQAGARAAAARSGNDPYPGRQSPDAADRGAGGHGADAAPAADPDQHFSPYRDHIGPGDQGPAEGRENRPGAPQDRRGTPPQPYPQQGGRGRHDAPHGGGPARPAPGRGDRPSGPGPSAAPGPRVEPGSATYGGGLPGPVRRPQGGTNALPAPRPGNRPGPGDGPGAPPGPGALPAPHHRPGAPLPAPRGGVPDGARAVLNKGVTPGARPGNALAAERARQARITIVGAVTERWAPEQAGPVHAHWQLTPPVGPATDLWAIGALLYRSVQGHAPYAEDSAAELVQLICARPPAHAEECGALRPVVESLLRADPTERPDFEELRGWLRSLVRSAPEPGAGTTVVTAPALGRKADPRRLPIKRRRGELVRKGRHKKSRARRERPQTSATRTAPTAAQPAPPRRDRAPEKPRRARPEKRRDREPQRYERQALRQEPPDFAAGAAQDARTGRDVPGPARGAGGGSPRRLGALLVGAILLVVVGAVLVAALLLPKSNTGESAGSGASGAASGAPGPEQSRGASADRDTGHPQTTAPGGVADGFEMRDDPEGFRVAVPKGWQRHGKNAQGQVRWTRGDFTLLVVPGRDTTRRFGTDPMAYQQDDEKELAPFREASWTSSSGLRRTDVGQASMAEGTFTWGDDSSSATYARNLAMIDQGRYHLLLVTGPDSRRGDVDRYYEQAAAAFRP